MNVSIGRELEDYVRSRVDSGDYASAGEVVRDESRDGEEVMAELRSWLLSRMG